MRRLSGIRKVGRYTNPETGRDVNVHTGRVVGRSTDVLFWLLQGKRQFITDREFYSGAWKEVSA